jgi:hypothetical protein
VSIALSVADEQPFWCPAAAARPGRLFFLSADFKLNHFKIIIPSLGQTWTNERASERAAAAIIEWRDAKAERINHEMAML